MGTGQDPWSSAEGACQAAAGPLGPPLPWGQAASGAASASSPPTPSGSYRSSQPTGGSTPPGKRNEKLRVKETVR